MLATQPLHWLLLKAAPAAAHPFAGAGISIAGANWYAKVPVEAEVVIVFADCDAEDAETEPEARP